MMPTARHDKGQLPFFEIAGEDLIRADLPEDDLAGAIVSLRNDPLKIEIVERMVLRPNREAPLLLRRGKPFRNRP